MATPHRPTPSRAGRSLRVSGPAAILLLCVACGTTDDETATEAASPTAAPTSTASVDPNDLLAECLAQQGLDVRRSGEVDGEMNAGVDLSHIDQSDANARVAIEECTALADAARRGDQEMPSAEAAQAGFERYMEEMTSCMLDHGFHLSVVDDPSGELVGSSAVIEYAPGEEGDPDFHDARTECTAAAQEAEQEAQDRIDG
jgi:hypothetical protein